MGEALINSTLGRIAPDQTQRHLDVAISRTEVLFSLQIDARRRSDRGKPPFWSGIDGPAAAPLWPGVQSGAVVGKEATPCRNYRGSVCTKRPFGGLPGGQAREL
jgi:hypothetical protein